ncbi:MAG: hypothetical protein JOY61_00310 [Chloroflexi bacterium]|nr:hypothetical protein [Chloroflexota bacterium]
MTLAVARTLNGLTFFFRPREQLCLQGHVVHVIGQGPTQPGVLRTFEVALHRRHADAHTRARRAECRAADTRVRQGRCASSFVRWRSYGLAIDNLTS